ncbi:hypothetical protein TNCV_3754071 [Trichonephila clavipes]|nr:hypothetical protein TNCV_3754071 [Trichonephila clavipes]
MFDIGGSSITEWGKNEMTIINMPKKKCALRKGVTKWPILEESVANWVLENRLNGLIVTRNNLLFGKSFHYPPPMDRRVLDWQPAAIRNG